MPLREWDRILASSPSMPMVLQFMDLELRLYDTDDLRSLSQFITCFPALERFTFGRQYRSWNRSGSSGDGDNLNEIVQCLFRVRTSLKYLCLESAGDCRRGCDEIQSLVEFSSLEVIDVVAFDLWLYTYDNGPDLGDDDKPLDPRVVPMVDLLPPHIRHLSLRLGSRMTVVHALGLLEAKKEQKQVSCLETLHITLTEYSHRPSKSEIDELLETGIKCGVKVIVERESLSGCLWKWKI
ncbi:uncharacterized protein LY89DRAFT_691313 [Mollisia scopiformis]|uniref:FBD domain-containing protein n=1 Tax=Mollisia scopiformis TaxID=149040 RepID=A0A132B6H0_MOLSC|nr:uncharacterized protein LY89DRAFT_691313 [Mollisia scopiformis]KUJ08002.1 hypothetical protein LY89DRAFT_691313 [Mollisia scopiformis]